MLDITLSDTQTRLMPEKNTHPETQKNKARKDEATRHAWNPSDPGVLEQALGKMSGWSKLVVPFLAQNIGWFISAFLFIAGSVFLVSYSEGFTGTLITAMILFIYPVLLITGVYHLRQRRPELHTTASVLTTLAMFLIPLSIAASVRLAQMGLPYMSVTGILAVIVNLAVFYWISQLASGLMDRSLAGAFPRMFMMLSAVQIATPMLSRIPGWHLMAGLHLTLLAILGYSLIRFTNDWLKSIFLDQRKLAYFSAGVLVYAALVSFVHLTWQYEAPLPHGYAGPFLMILAGLLFYADAKVKEWIKRHTFLSCLTFAVYALSVLALAICFNAPIPRFISLCLGAAVYAMLVRHYLSLVPLCLLLACLGALYYLGILQHCQWEFYFLASLPYCAILLGMHLWALKHNAKGLATMCFRILTMLAAELATWSLIHGGPGLTGMASCALISIMVYAVLRYAPRQFLEGLGISQAKSEKLPADPKDLRNTSWFYIVMMSWGLTAAYAPVFLRTWTEQFSVTLTLLAAVWTGLGMKLRIRENTSAKALLLFKGALMGICPALALMLTTQSLLQNPCFHLILMVSGGVLTCQSLVLRRQGMFCFALTAFGAAAALIKHTYFPHLSVGLAEIMTIFAIWAVIWKLENRQDMLAILETIRQSLHFAMIILWAWAVFCLTKYVLVSEPDFLWILSAGLGTLATLLLTAYFRLRSLCFLPMTIGLGVLIGFLAYLQLLNPVSMNTAAILYAMLTWALVRWLASQEFIFRLADLMHLSKGQNDSKMQIEQHTFWAANLIALLAVSAAISNWIEVPSLSVLHPLLSGMIFFGITGKYYQQRLSSYLLLAISAAVFFSLHVQLLGIADSQLLVPDPRSGFLLALLGIGMATAAWTLNRLRHQDKADDFSQSLYRKPLCVSSAVLALAAAGHQLALIWNQQLTSQPMLCFSLSALFISGIALLSANYKLEIVFLNLLGVLLTSLSLFLAEMLLFRGEIFFSFLPGDWDQWLTLSLLSTGLAFLAAYIRHDSRVDILYVRPMRKVAALGWALLMLRLLVAFVAGLSGNSNGICIPFLFLVQGLALFPLLMNHSRAGVLRGISLLFLLTGFFITILPLIPFLEWNRMTQFAWAFILWGISEFILPRFNKARPDWAVGSGAWPWFGLLLLVFPFYEKGISFDEYSCWLGTGTYLLLMVRSNSWYGLYAMAAGALTFGGTLFFGNIASDLAFQTGKLFAGSLIWANLLLFVLPLLHRVDASLTKRHEWKTHEPSAPFLGWASALMALSLLPALPEDFSIFLPNSVQGHPLASLFLSSLLLTNCLFHLFRFRHTLLSAHCLIASLFNMVFTASLNFPFVFSHLPLLLAFLSLSLLGAHMLWERKQWGGEHLATMSKALSAWTMIAPWTVLPAILLIPVASFRETLLALAMTTGTMTFLGYRDEKSWLIISGRLLGVILLHTWLLMFLPPGKTKGLVLLHDTWGLLCAQFERLQVLFPWYALQLAILAWAVIGLRRWLTNRSENQWTSLQRLLGSPAPYAMLALGEWMLSLLVFSGKLSLMPPTNLWIHGIPTLLTSAFLIHMGIRKTVQSKKGWWAYGTALIVGLTGTYLRLLLLGLTPLTLWDTTALMGSAYAVFMVQRFVTEKSISTPLYRMTLLMPLLAILTVPLEFASSFSAGIFMAAGALYLSVRHTTGRSLPLYLGVLAINAAIYLWVPAWSAQYNLIQLYIVPAALSVLILLHLHQKELRRSVLNNTRLAAVSVLYVSSGLDIFQDRPEFWIFGLALFLGLAGAAIGIAMRIRAFLYGGVVFLVVNVVGQLIRFYPEQGLSKGILLMLLGALMMAGMVWFNIRRESILKQIRIFRADLDCWA